MHDSGINNYHSLCGSEASLFTIDVALRDDDDDEKHRTCKRKLCDRSITNKAA